MKHKRKKIFVGLLILVLVGSIAGAAWWPGAVEASYPQVDGEINLPGLDGPVDVYRDASGIPHIYATTEHDLFMAQGYVHAQDRFWQMDFNRHVGGGRVSELVGGSAIETDKFLRTMGWLRVAEEELKQIDDNTRFVLESYSEGVNAYLADHTGTDLALEYAFISLLNPGYEPQPWEPIHVITWAKAMAWDLKSNMENEIFRSAYLQTMTPEQVNDLFPPYPEDRPVIVGDQSGFVSLQRSPDGAAYAAAVGPAVNEIAAKYALVDKWVGSGMDEGVGSNSWAISGKLSASGMPLIANDVHLKITIPHIWYQIGLHCVEKTPECRIDEFGYSFAGTPGIVIGHNDRIAWAFTNVGPDVIDLYIEKINPDNPYQYEYMGEWVDMEVITETLKVGTKDSEVLEVRITRHGPIITDVYGPLKDFGEEAGIDLPENYAIAMRWTALEPTNVFGAVLGFNYAQNWEEFRQAASLFDVPAQNFLYTDVEGNLAYQMPGNIPIRSEGHDGRYPVPGWTGEYEWQGYIPFEERPYIFNPEAGYIVTANNAVVDASYPYRIADTWAYGNRAQRIVDMIENAPGPIDAAYFQQMHGDNLDMTAVEVVPVLMDTPLNDPKLESVRDLLRGWDFQADVDSQAAAVWGAFWKHLVLNTLDEVPEDKRPSGDARILIFYRPLLADADNAWWDVIATPEKETRDEIMRAALADAAADLEERMGKDPAGWIWGGIHQIYFENQVMTSLPVVKNAFNRGPYAIPGGISIVNAAPFNVNNPDYRVDGMSASMRMIVDLSDLTNALTIIPVGQSGHPGHPNYVDQTELWRNIEYVPMLWARADVEQNAKAHLRLVP